MGLWAIFLMSVVCVACATATLGLWHRRRWGYWTAISILAINLLGDTINAFALWDWRTLIGLPIAGFLIAYLLRKRTAFSGAAHLDDLKQEPDLQKDIERR